MARTSKKKSDQRHRAANRWLENEALSQRDTTALDTTLAAYEKSPDAGTDWDAVKKRIESKLPSGQS
jgi:hypothetical protein